MRIPDISRRPWRNIDIVIIGLLDVADGLAKVLTLGEKQTCLCMDYICWRTVQMMKERS